MQVSFSGHIRLFLFLILTNLDRILLFVFCLTNLSPFHPLPAPHPLSWKGQGSFLSWPLGGTNREQRSTLSEHVWLLHSHSHGQCTRCYDKHQTNTQTNKKLVCTICLKHKTELCDHVQPVQPLSGNICVPAQHDEGQRVCMHPATACVESHFQPESGR